MSPRHVVARPPDPVCPALALARLPPAASSQACQMQASIPVLLPQASAMKQPKMATLPPTRRPVRARDMNRS